jgi:hypothetical protein
MQIKIASPCKRDWSKMSGDEKVRACGDCKMNVYNLSAMSEAEAQELVKQREGRVCVRFFMRPDGTAMTKDCPVGVSRARRTYAVALGAVAALIAMPFMGKAASCPTSAENASIIDDARAALYQVKLKLGLASPPPVMMGELSE